ncbi:hypothetical protein [Streptomyces sp. ISL-100]|uniref:hypothetical protein n=1 Tax=Streptomyces sp. ISL-100 TaxID=2819173 RepID=UPI001BECBEC2|nr:hypothetical protein [Streptomyces sp. ISL-100]MBT2397860.1 hypothetical protein [Streptomyces sp. ISL-100]
MNRWRELGCPAAVNRCPWGQSAAGGFVGRLAHGQRLELEELQGRQVCGAMRRRGRGWAA